MIDVDRYGPWAVVAGGSEGVGASMADQLGAAGLNLVLIARKPGPLEETAEAVRRHGVEVRTLALDLTDPAAPHTVHDATRDLEVGLLVYNAGANAYGSEFVEGDLDRFQQVIDLNVTAQLALVHHFGAAMKRRRRGGLLLIGSLAGFMGAEQISVYAAVKAFCRTFAEGLWLEMLDHDVHVLEFVLGVTRTPAMVRGGLNMDLPGLHVSEPDDVARQALAQIADGPVQIAAGNEHLVAARSSQDRAGVLREARERTRRMLPPAAAPSSSRA